MGWDGVHRRAAGDESEAPRGRSPVVASGPYYPPPPGRAAGRRPPGRASWACPLACRPPGAFLLDWRVAGASAQPPCCLSQLYWGALRACAIAVRRVRVDWGGVGRGALLLDRSGADVFAQSSWPGGRLCAARRAPLHSCSSVGAAGAAGLPCKGRASLVSGRRRARSEGRLTTSGTSFRGSGACPCKARANCRGRACTTPAMHDPCHMVQVAASRPGASAPPMIMPCKRRATLPRRCAPRDPATGASPPGDDVSTCLHSYMTTCPTVAYHHARAVPVSRFRVATAARGQAASPHVSRHYPCDAIVLNKADPATPNRSTPRRRPPITIAHRTARQRRPIRMHVRRHAPSRRPTPSVRRHRHVPSDALPVHARRAAATPRAPAGRPLPPGGLGSPRAPAAPVRAVGPLPTRREWYIPESTPAQSNAIRSQVRVTIHPRHIPSQVARDRHRTSRPVLPGSRFPDDTRSQPPEPRTPVATPNDTGSTNLSSPCREAGKHARWAPQS